VKEDNDKKVKRTMKCLKQHASRKKRKPAGDSKPHLQQY